MKQALYLQATRGWIVYNIVKIKKIKNSAKIIVKTRLSEKMSPLMGPDKKNTIRQTNPEMPSFGFESECTDHSAM